MTTTDEERPQERPRQGGGEDDGEEGQKIEKGLMVENNSKVMGEISKNNKQLRTYKQNLGFQSFLIVFSQELFAVLSKTVFLTVCLPENMLSPINPSQAVKSSEK